MGCTDGVTESHAEFNFYTMCAGECLGVCIASVSSHERTLRTAMRMELVSMCADASPGPAPAPTTTPLPYTPAPTLTTTSVQADACSGGRADVTCHCATSCFAQEA
eukprot:1545285-Amphidinium_carterae.1